MMEILGARLEKGVRYFMPDPFVLVLLLTLVVFGASLWTGNNAPPQLLQFWYSGFWELLSFAMQMVLIVVTGEAIAESPLIQKAIKKLCSIPRSPFSAIVGLTFFSITLGWLHWGFALIAASLGARALAIQLSHRKINVHYPILATAAYTSMLLWHAGTTASAPLLINTPGHFLENQIGLVPLSQTIFSLPNLLVCSFLAISVPIYLYQLHPSRGIKPIDSFKIGNQNDLKKISEEKPKTFAEKLERSYLCNFFLGAMGVLFLLHYFRNKGIDLNHNIVNFLLVTVGMLLHRNPLTYVRAITKSLRGTSGIVIQFPFYGGIMGLMRESGLGHEIAHFFIQNATAHSLPLFAYFASVFTKLFIPSGGGEWAVEAPVMLQAAKQLGSSIGQVTMGISYGNMVGNMFQPFWTIPLLSIMGLNAREMMGYCLAVFLFAFPVLAIVLYIS